MEKFLYLILLLFVVTLVGCQNKTNQKNASGSSVPEAVSQAFQTKYPGENNPDWEVDSLGNYETHFKKKGRKYIADFRPDGIWVETESSINKKNLAKEVKNSLKEDYSCYKIIEVEDVAHATKGIFYEVEFKQKGKNKDVIFKEDGTIIE